MRRRASFDQTKLTDIDDGRRAIVTEFDDGETYSEPWGSKEDTELAVCIRSQDIRRKVK